jgi:hypothetical protein
VDCDATGTGDGFNQMMGNEPWERLLNGKPYPDPKSR